MPVPRHASRPPPGNVCSGLLSCLAPGSSDDLLGFCSAGHLCQHQGCRPGSAAGEASAPSYTCRWTQNPEASPATGPGAGSPRNWPFCVLIPLPWCPKPPCYPLNTKPNQRTGVCRCHWPARLPAGTHPLPQMLYSPLLLKARSPDFFQLPERGATPPLADWLKGPSSSRSLKVGPALPPRPTRLWVPLPAPAVSTRRVRPGMGRFPTCRLLWLPHPKAYSLLERKLSAGMGREGGTGNQGEALW